MTKQIGIIRVDMPKSCMHCDYTTGFRCVITGISFIEIEDGKKLPDCPIVVISDGAKQELFKSIEFSLEWLREDLSECLSEDFEKQEIIRNQIEDLKDADKALKGLLTDEQRD